MSDASMEISAGKGPATLVNVIAVDPANQDELVREMVDGVANIASKAPGFVSAALHRSVDGTRVVNYVHWVDTDAWQAAYEYFSDHPGFHHHMEEVRRIATPDPHLYEVVAVIEKSAD
ncbi:MAG TPA: antibiotic biosynthesis monooxygenase family protein [Solirubrobacteraceae bacterium]|nr:antibiotic biosynthesis monooxygenase family protein [Solirubrobacteraceae bacterium]